MRSGSTWRCCGILFFVTAIGAGAASGLDAPEMESTAPELVSVSFRGVSPPVRELRPMQPGEAPAQSFFDREHGESVETGAPDEEGSPYGLGTLKIDDRLVSPPRSDGEPEAPDLLLEFEGLSSIVFGPADPDGAVGPDHYVQFVNIQFQVFDKQGRALTEPLATNALWEGSGGTCESDLYADAVVHYDAVAERWVVVHLAAALGKPLATCIAVSTGPDPTGEFFLYELETLLVPDYPKLGVWPDPVNNAYVITTLPGEPGTHDVYALDRESLLSGVAPRPAQRFRGYPNMLMPGDFDGTRHPPINSPIPLYTFRDGGESYFVPPSPVDSLDVYELTIDWDVPGNSHLVLARSFTPPVFAEFNWTLCGWNVPDCLRQPGTDQKIDSISWIPMQRFQYRNLGDYEALVGVWTVNTLAEGRHAAPRWFELRRYLGGEWELVHQGTFAPNRSHRWMSSVALDGSGNMAMGYSVVNAPAGVYPSLCYTVRPAGSQDFLAERTLATGTGWQTGSSRWGDYASMDVDPVDDCTFWFTGVYMKTTGDTTWSTRIGAFRVEGCTGELAAGKTTE